MVVKGQKQPYVINEKMAMALDDVMTYFKINRCSKYGNIFLDKMHNAFKSTIHKCLKIVWIYFQNKSKMYICNFIALMTQIKSIFL